MENMTMGQYQGGCGRVGYAYVPVQQFGEIYSPEEALRNGTLFRELNLTIDQYGMR